jgi:membrane-bound inhibitor of C-type lysozyme
MSEPEMWISFIVTHRAPPPAASTRYKPHVNRNCAGRIREIFVKIKTAAPILFLLALTACESGYKKSPVVTPQPMSCNGNVPAQVTLYSPTEAKLTFEEKSYNLNRIETASGVKYGNSDITYWNKGIDAMITKRDGTISTCTYVPKSGL